MSTTTPPVPEQKPEPIKRCASCGAPSLNLMNPSPAKSGLFYCSINMNLHLTEEEVNELCAPLKQRAAQIRFIQHVLRIPISGKRPDGLPLVGRTVAESRLNNEQPLASDKKSGFNWSRSK
jgi:hypothetical protein